MAKSPTAGVRRKQASRRPLCRYTSSRRGRAKEIRSASCGGRSAADALRSQRRRETQRQLVSLRKITETSSRNVIRLTNGLLVGVGALQVLLLGAQVWVYMRQAGIMERQADLFEAQQKAAAEVERPRLFVESAKITPRETPFYANDWRSEARARHGRRSDWTGSIAIMWLSRATRFNHARHMGAAQAPERTIPIPTIRRLDPRFVYPERRLVGHFSAWHFLASLPTAPPTRSPSG